jgi:protein phosphatase
MEEAQRI